jgi:ubiquinone/menaquinone biosynthesis C-methylase UbiE
MTRNGVMILKMGKLQRRYINKQENAAKKLPFLDEMLAEVDLSGMRDRLGVDVVGTDVDPAEIEFARRHSGGTVGLTFVEADSTALPFADGEFDLVLSMMVMHHIPNWRGALTEIVRVLRPGGSFLFHDLTYSWFLKAAFKPVMRSHAFYSIDEISGHLHKSGMQAIYASAPHKYLYDQFTEYNFVFVKK